MSASMNLLTLVLLSLHINESPNHDLILPTDGVPCIFNILYQGESIILDDIESIKNSMPTEYNFFWK